MSAADEDTVVLVPHEPEEPPRRVRPNRETTVALVVAAVLVLLSLTVIGRRSSAPLRPDDHDPGTRRFAIAPGAFGRLLFTVPEPAEAGDFGPERLWSFSLETGALESGPLLPTVSAREGFPAQPPSFPPDRRFALGPEGSQSANLLAFLADDPLSAEGDPRSVVYVIDVGNARLPRSAAAVGEAVAFAWTSSGELVLAREDGLTALIVERALPSTGTRRTIGRVSRPIGVRPDLVTSGGGIVFLAYAGRVERVIPGGGTETVLSGWDVLSAGPGGVLVLASRERRALHWWFAGRADPPAPIETPFSPVDVLGWSSDGSTVAVLGVRGERVGLWLVPLFRGMPEGPIHETDGQPLEVGPAAFGSEDRIVLFATTLGIDAYDRTALRVIPVPLQELARKQPSGPVVWVP